MRKNRGLYRALENTIAIVMMMMCFVVMPGLAGYIETHYTMTCEVDNVEGEIITVLDGTGNLWDFCGDGFRKGDRVKVTFFNNTTDYTRYDDEIIKVEKNKKIQKNY